MARFRFPFLLSICLLLVFNQLPAQKVGLVLSGGGIRGLAHIGVIRALEENNIPVDYITGTSAGALIGSMYSIGLTPQEITSLATSVDFIKRASGDYDEENDYYFKKNPADASWITIKMIVDSVFRTQLPSNVVNPAEIDFTLMEIFAATIAAANYNFDSLMVPFRCVAADITAKRQVVFRNGDLALAVRASMAFPFYYAPVLIGDNILYDGGIYNNFPTDIMQKDFNPDIIIGVSAAGIPEVPVEGNFLSQLKTMITHTTSYQVPRETDILIEPDIRNLGTFAFNSVEAAIDSGYAAGLRAVPLIREKIQRRSDPDSLNLKRVNLKNSSFSISVDRIYVYGVNAEQADYIRATLNPRNQCISLQQLKLAWFKLVTDDNQRYIFPRLMYNPESGNYDLHLDVKKNKGVFLDFGGTVSSRPINTGFVGIQHNFWGRQSLRVNGNIYFGKLYSSGQARFRLDVPGSIPFYIEPSATFNQWDYYKSSSAFFEDIKPSFLVQYDRSYALNIGMPARNKGKVVIGGNSFRTKDRYYLTRQFSESDTTDQTTLEGLSAYLDFERNTLNRKMYASEGTFFDIRLRYIEGEEQTLPGSTGILRDTTKADHEWLQLRVQYDNYFKQFGILRIGFHAEMMFSSQTFFSTYTASVASAPAFQPIADMKTQFLESYHAHNYFGAGLRNVFRINNSIDLRLEGYMFQPFQEILQDENFRPKYGDAFNKRYFVGCLNTVYHSPVGPVSLALNYYDQRDKPFSFIFHLGYIIFNRKALQ